MQSATDFAILLKAREEGRVVISADADFSRLMASRRWVTPSILLLKRTPRRKDAVLRLLLDCLPGVEEPLVEGSLVVIEPARIRVRRLPVAG